MNRFVQIHTLTSYPPANLNRDDSGRPKTAMMGGALRLRVSSQSLKRAWRCSEIFAETVKGHCGTRTKRMGLKIYQEMIDKGVSQNKAGDWTKQIVERFGAPKSLSKKDKEKMKDMSPEQKVEKQLIEFEIEQLAHFSPEEEKAISSLIDTLAARGNSPTEDELELLREKHTAADIALFGRMLASSPRFNTEAAAQVAHAISVHKIAVENDYFTAVDDLKDNIDDAGAAHIGETEFASGLMYSYVCIDRELLKSNLSDDEKLTSKTLAALVEAIAKVPPTGMQNRFGTRAYASYMLCEKGDQQPRSLSVAFLKPISGEDMLTSAVKKLTSTRDKIDKVYGSVAEKSFSFDCTDAESSLPDLIQFASE